VFLYTDIYQGFDSSISTGFFFGGNYKLNQKLIIIRNSSYEETEILEEDIKKIEKIKKLNDEEKIFLRECFNQARHFN
jgi:hypothetical protein